MSTSEPVGPPAPPGVSPTPFPSAKVAIPNVEGSHAPGAWQRLTHALGTDLQRGMWRAEQSRRRIARGT